MALSCSKCSASIPNDSVNLDLMLAECPSCHHVQQLGTVGDGARDATRPPLGDLPVPMGVDVAESLDDLVITFAWWHWRYIIQLVFCLFWNGFMVNWFAITLSTGNYPFAAFGLLHAAVGLALAYTGVAGLVNHTTITASRGALTVAHGPMPWWGGRTMARDDISQLYCVEHVTKSKNGRQVTWSVDAVDRDQRSVTLLKGVTDLAQARFFEHRVERFLGIADRAIDGEV